MMMKRRVSLSFLEINGILRQLMALFAFVDVGIRIGMKKRGLAKDHMSGVECMDYVGLSMVDVKF